MKVNKNDSLTQSDSEPEKFFIVRKNATKTRTFMGENSSKGFNQE
jgi:hypothetical protein